jgi:hypothetical protein
MSKKEESKRSGIVIVKIASGNPYINEWHMAEKVSGGYKNLVKVLQPIQEQLVNGQQGPVKQKVLGMYEFFMDDFFADQVFVPETAFLYSRELTTDDEILKGYDNVIVARKKAMIEAEAKKKLAEADKPNTTEISQ